VSRRHRKPPDGLVAGLVFLILGAIYVATLLPGLGGTEDTPKFQYVGAALGTPHDPGYPLYMIACWVFSKLPVGTLAYRINLLSACWGALAGAFVYLAQRRLAVPRVLAVCLALGLGLGRAFWEHSTFAEAYTQVSALTAAAFLALLVWDEDGRERWLYAAVAAVCLAFGTHLIIVGMVPVFAWFVLSRYRWRIPLRVLAAIALLVLLGLAQYGYVWIRTVQHARYLEASATSVEELVETLRGAQFDDQTFKDPILVLIRTRVPGVAAAAMADMGALAALGLAAGLVSLWRTRRRAAALLAFGAIGPAILLAMLGDVATQGILLPALMPCWILAGAGFGWLWGRARSLDLHPVARRTALAAALVLAAAVPAGQAWQNFDASNSRYDTYYTEYLGALFETLPGRAAFVDEGYTFPHMIEYQAYATQRSGVSRSIPPDPDLIATLLEDGTAVYALKYGLASIDGRVRVRPVTLSAQPLDERLRWLRDGTVVVIAGYANRWPDLGRLALGERAPRVGRWIVVAVKGSGAVLVTTPRFEEVFTFRAGDPLGSTGQAAPVALRIEMRGGLTSIAVDGQILVATDGGLAVAEVGVNGVASYELRRETLFKAPLDMTGQPLYRVVGVTPEDSCTALPNGAWRPLANPGLDARLVGRLDRRGPFDALWTLYLAGDEPLPVSFGDMPAPVPPDLTVEPFTPLQDAGPLRERLTADGLATAPELLSSPAVSRLTVRSHGGATEGVVRLNLGGLPARGWGRVAIVDARPPRVSLCDGAVEPLVPDTVTEQAPVYLGPGGNWFFGAGWHNPDPVPAGYQRRTDGARATLLLPVERPAAITLRMSIEPLDGARAVAVTLNGRRLPEQPLTAGSWNDVAWPVGADGWRVPVNELAIDILGAPLSSAPAGAAPTLRVRSVALNWSRSQ
jgi:hypothetical protein